MRVTASAKSQAVTAQLATAVAGDFATCRYTHPAPSSGKIPKVFFVASMSEMRATLRLERGSNRGSSGANPGQAWSQRD
jgi:hypothetical protein